MLWLKINSYKEFDKDKKIPVARKFPSPHNFSNGPTLTSPTWGFPPSCKQALKHCL